ARGPGHPLVIAGGPCAFNPEPLAPFLDGVLLGDGEEAVGDICDRVLAWDGRDRGALLRALADIPGFYVPAFFAPRYHAEGTIAEVVPLEPARPRVHKRVLVDLDRFAPERVAVSLPSTRVEALSPRILEQIRRVRKTGFTLAPEAGTQRLRDVIQKEYREEELLRAARLFADLGWRSLKLYFMIGL